MSNIRAITGSSKIVHRNQGGGSKKQGIPSSTNLNTWSHVAFRNRNVVCACNRHVVFCMNQLGGVGAGGVPGNSYMFAPGADGINKNKILGGIDHSHIPSNILKKITSKKLLVDSTEQLSIWNFNKNNFYFLEAETPTLADQIKQILQPNKHYIIEYNISSSNYKVFFTLVKNTDPNSFNYQIKNVSPPSIKVQGNSIYNVKLYEVVTKYI